MSEHVKTRMGKAVVFVLATMDQLIDRGVLERTGPSPLTKKGRTQYKKLVEEKFEPTDSEMVSALIQLQEQGFIQIGKEKRDA